MEKKLTLTCDCGCRIKGNERHNEIYYLCMDCGFFEVLKMVIANKLIA